LEVGMVLPPGQVDELAVGGDAIDHGVAIGEVALELAEAGDLGRTDEGEVLGPEEHQLPLALVALLAEALEGVGGVGGNHALNGKIGEFVADGQHVYSLE